MRILRELKIESSRFIALTLITLVAGLMITTIASAMPRIVIAPSYTEQGSDAGSPRQLAQHYRRVIRFIGNRLVQQGYEVINPFAREISEQEYSRNLQRAREDSPLAAKALCKKYASEIAYIIKLELKRRKTVDGFCKATVALNGEGYDSVGRDLGVGIFEDFIVTRRDCRKAVAEAEKDVGDIVGRRLSTWMENKKKLLAQLEPGNTKADYPIKKKEQLNKLIEVRLDGATEYTLSEVFAKVINTTTGVVEAIRMASSIVPNNPQASWVIWRVKIEGTDPVRLQANMLKMVRDILKADGTIHHEGVPYRYTKDEIALLHGIRPGDSTSQKIQFIIDRNLARENEPKRSTTSEPTQKQKPIKSRTIQRPAITQITPPQPKPEPCKNRSKSISQLEFDVKESLKEKYPNLIFNFKLCGQIITNLTESSTEYVKSSFMVETTYSITVLINNRSKTIEGIPKEGVARDPGTARDRALENLKRQVIEHLENVIVPAGASARTSRFVPLRKMIQKFQMDTAFINKSINSGERTIIQ